MNKRLLVGVFSALMAMAPLSGNAATQSIDAPHLSLTDGCENCHFAGLAPSDCTVRCHQSDVGPYADTVSPLAATHKDLKCEACHNPHVSLQPTGVTGSFGAVTYDSVSKTSTLTGVTPAPDASWAAKTKATRGLILWVADGATDNASFEIKGIAGDTVTVAGDMSAITARSFDLRRGQLIAKKVTKTAGQSYIQGDLPVQFPSVGSSQVYIDTVNATPTGVCQVCHTTTAYWTSNGANPTHNPDRVCTECHTHDTGFMPTACNGCHTSPIDLGTGLPTNPDGVPVDEAGMSKPPTGSVTAGQHKTHAIDHQIPCATCHTGTGMDRISDPKHPIADGKIQIGFSEPTYPQGYLTSYDGQATVVYEGKNHTTITNNGTMVCSNVYCHSSGKAPRLGCATPTANTTRHWDGSSPDPQGESTDPLVLKTPTCNNCHGFELGRANPIMSGVHYYHVDNGTGTGRGFGCYVCHADTTQPIGTIADSNIQAPSELIPGVAKNANGAIEIKGRGTYGPNAIVFNTTTTTPPPANGWNPTTKECAVACHSYGLKTWVKKGTTAELGADLETCIPAATLCAGDASTNSALVNIDPVVAWQTTNVDNNTLVFKDVSSDPDRIDPVKNLCQNGGFNGANGLLKIQNANDQKIGNVAPGVPLNGLTQPSSPIARSFRSIGVTPVNGTTQVLDLADPAQPKGWMLYTAADNGPLSKGLINRTAAVPNDGITRSGWFAHIFTPIDESTVNLNPILDYVVPTAANGGIVRTGANTCRLTIQNTTVDPDADVPAKKVLFGAGHDGSIGRERLYLLNKPDAVDLVGDTGYRAATYPQNAPINTTFVMDVKGAPGYILWYQVEVRDNHYVAISADREKKSFTVKTGWMYVTLP